MSEVEISIAIEENKKLLGVLHGILGVNDYAICDPAKRYRQQIVDQLKEQQMTDVPELMAASSRSTGLIPEDFDPLGQVD